MSRGHGPAISPSRSADLPGSGDAFPGKPVRLGRRAALLAVVLATTLTASALADGTPLSAPTAGPLVAAKRVKRPKPEPRSAFPFQARAAPQYGDGLDAGRGHEGQDIFAPAGTPLVAVADSVVLETGSDGGRGNYVSIYDPAAQRTYNYFHMLGPALPRRGERLAAGEKLGEVGCTGSCWGDHLHFELRAGRDPYGTVLDPMPLLQRLKEAESRSKGASRSRPSPRPRPRPDLPAGYRAAW